ncbi:isopeptide-forming domain-containing fimbrial protein [Allofournierella massiliensis]|uniref:isopeptide-forming domain-containing fimbrial protein n=1 Tax=Allofournierella massiliensis TaxID=1650663 RepID=UPI0024B11911|nr:isopeptide-forming domain-containing fimbrial protein [Fournierella massiliensis]
MKKQMKRATAVALATAMTMGMSFPAFAAGNGGDRTLVVTGDTLDNKKVYAVQMFDARVTEGGSSNTFDNYELVNTENWLEFFTANTEAGGMGLTDQDDDSDIDADDVRAYLEGMTADSAEVKTLADKAQAWVRNHSTDFAVITSDDETPAVADKETFTQLKAGYYLVYPEGGSTGTGNRGTDAMLVNVPTDANAEWAMKSTFPTVDKKVDTDGEGGNGAADNGSAQVGDVVTFTLTSAVPDMSDYTTFYFAFNDTLSNGLKVVDNTGADVVDGDNLTIDGLTVTIDGETVTGYTVSLHSNVLKVEFTNLKSVTQAAEAGDIGKAIVVTYKAMITEGAVVGNPALNTVKVEYSNDPTTGTTGESTPDESDVFTYEIDVNKWSTEAGGITGNLAGAEFKLTTDKAGEQVVELIATEDGYRVAKPDEVGVNSFTTTEVGDITISGLEAGTYYLHEVAAPEGYNKLKAPIEIKIEMTNEETGAATITVNGKPATGDGSTTVDVENKKGIELPETGSIGTIGLTVAGVAIVLVGVFAPRKKKENQE